MKDIYNDKIIGLYQVKFLYTAPNSGQIDHCFNTQNFYRYSLVTEKMCLTQGVFDFSTDQALSFCKLNNIKIIKGIL